VIQVLLYIGEDDKRKTAILNNLSGLQSDFPHQLHIINISDDPILLNEFGEKSPVLDIGIYRLIWDFDESEIKKAFSKSTERLVDAESKGNRALIERISMPLNLTKTDKFSRWFSKHYMLIVNGFTFLYVFLAILAPVFMQVGWELPGKTIYKIYRPLCHQLAFRSFFLFGEQLYYPRELAGVRDVITYSDATGYDDYDLETARDFLGDETLGYKMALCQRDIAIYSVILLFGICFSLSGNKIKPLPWYLWLILGLGPIGLDGFSQLLSQSGFSFLNWLPLRESTPLLRTLTGAFFGLATAWFGFPYLEESVQGNRQEMQLKAAITKQMDEKLS
jgi:uncharacterized membrane protein